VAATAALTLNSDPTNGIDPRSRDEEVHATRAGGDRRGAASGTAEDARAMNLSDALEISSCTDPGIVRSHNEDSVAADPANGLVVLADGMGGYNAGEVASGMATTVIQAEVAQILGNVEPHLIDEKTNKVFAELILREQIRKANASIYQAAQAQSRYAGMGTTLVVCLFYDNRVMVGHLGDSRLYRLRDKKLKQVTRDHSLLQEQIDAGLITPEQAKTAAHKNLVTRALGIDPGVEPELHEYRTQPGDIFLLCSDGLCDMVSDEDIALTLKALGRHLNLATQQLVQMANDNGGRDNVSVILVRVLREYPAARGVVGKFFAWLK
jgi:serine/threonine protein phosphatase PrpC